MTDTIDASLSSKRISNLGYEALSAAFVHIGIIGPFAFPHAGGSAIASRGPMARGFKGQYPLS